tara:strand:- start:80 stop:265 length:186 start_codon:yes stop_codon:yes gene_type:complete
VETIAIVLQFKNNTIMKKRITLTQEEIQYILNNVYPVLDDEDGYMEDLISVCKSLKKKLTK